MILSFLTTFHSALQKISRISYATKNVRGKSTISPIQKWPKWKKQLLTGTVPLSLSGNTILRLHLIFRGKKGNLELKLLQWGDQSHHSDPLWLNCRQPYIAFSRGQFHDSTCDLPVTGQQLQLLHHSSPLSHFPRKTNKNVDQKSKPVQVHCGNFTDIPFLDWKKKRFWL